jgi:hypothetical protein
MRNNSYNRLTLDNGGSKLIKVDKGGGGLIRNHAVGNGDRTRLVHPPQYCYGGRACSFRRLAENIVATIKTNLLVRQNGEMKFAATCRNCTPAAHLYPISIAWFRRMSNV